MVYSQTHTLESQHAQRMFSCLGTASLVLVQVCGGVLNMRSRSIDRRGRTDLVSRKALWILKLVVSEFDGLIAMGRVRMEFCL